MHPGKTEITLRARTTLQEGQEWEIPTASYITNKRASCPKSGS